jgi:alpha-tubulin suppressor-like RCC1 family protein
MRRAVFLGVAGVVPAAIVVSSCLDATQITLDVRTSFDCSASKTQTGMLVGGPSVLTASGPFNAQVSRCARADEVGKLVVVPSGSLSDPVHVRVVAGVDGTGAETCAKPIAERGVGSFCIESKRIVHFVSHQSLTLPITLDRSCINVTCPRAEQTCVAGQCTDANVTPTCLDDPRRCDAGVEPPIDAGPSDARADGRDSGPNPTSSVARLLASGFDNACAVATSNGKEQLYCWGDNKNLQLPGVKALAGAPTLVPITIGGFNAVQMIAVGGGHICVSDGANVACWGNNSVGQTGRGSTMAAPDIQLASLGANTQLVSLASGGTFTCVAEKVIGSYCWGSVTGWLAYGSKPVLAVNANVALFTELGAGEAHVIGRNAVGIVWTWGDNAYKQLGSFVDAGSGVSVPTKIASGADLVAAGFGHSGASGIPGSYFWGLNQSAEIPTMQPQVPGQIVFGASHTCLLPKAGGDVLCRGSNAAGQCGPQAPDPQTGWRAVPLPMMDKPTTVVAGRTHTCALAQSGRIYCWGTLAPVVMGPTPIEIVLP